MPTSKTLPLALLFAVDCTNADLLPAPDGPGIDVVVIFTPAGDGSAFRARLGNKTYSTSGGFVARLAPGDNRVNGSFRGSGLGVAFQTIGAAGGVRSGTVRSRSGPLPREAACSISYANPDTAGDAADVENTFEVQFTVAPDPATACPGPPP